MMDRKERARAYEQITNRRALRESMMQLLFARRLSEPWEEEGPFIEEVMGSVYSETGEEAPLLFIEEDRTKLPLKEGTEDRRKRDDVSFEVPRLDSQEETSEKSCEFPPEKIQELFSEKEAARRIYYDLLEQLPVIDGLIEDHLRGWKLYRLAKVDLSVLEVAVYELAMEAPVPYQVVINEALEISKKYSNEDATKFINGVLASILRDLKKE